MKTYGRKTIYANYTEKELLSMDEKNLIEAVIDIVSNSQFIHETNKNETRYLKKYFIGKQDIYIEKVKKVRDDIDHHTVENWAYSMIDFKTSWLLGKPIQYVQLDDEGTEQISKLNKYCRYEKKRRKDLELYEDILVTGRGFRYVGSDKVGEEDEAPFELINSDPALTECVYSSQLGNKQLLSYVETSMMYIDTKTKKKDYYSEFTIYLRGKQIVISNKGEWHVVPQLLDGVSYNILPILHDEHTITEYYTNRNRISLIELGKDIFNQLNYLESLDMDDMEQFVNAIMVFTNVEATKDDIDSIKKMGAVMIESTDGKEAKIELLEQRLNADGTQIFYNRLVNALHQILGIPKADDSGGVSYGDTGQARLTGQGFVASGIRATKDEVMFGDRDMESMKAIISICKLATNDTGIIDIRVSDFEPHFQRDMRDNLLVKTQALLNLKDANIPRKIANEVVGLFSDANAVTILQNETFGNEVVIDSGIKENIDNTNQEQAKLQVA